MRTLFSWKSAVICLAIVITNFLTLNFTFDSEAFFMIRSIVFAIGLMSLPIVVGGLVVRFLNGRIQSIPMRGLAFSSVLLLLLITEVMSLVFILFGVVPTPSSMAVQREFVDNKVVYVGNHNGDSSVLVATNFGGGLYHLDKVCVALFKNEARFEKVDANHIRCSKYGDTAPILITI